MNAVNKYLATASPEELQQIYKNHAVNYESDHEDDDQLKEIIEKYKPPPFVFPTDQELLEKLYIGYKKKNQDDCNKVPSKTNQRKKGQPNKDKNKKALNIPQKDEFTSINRFALLQLSDSDEDKNTDKDDSDEPNCDEFRNINIDEENLPSTSSNLTRNTKKSVKRPKKSNSNSLALTNKFSLLAISDSEDCEDNNVQDVATTAKTLSTATDTKETKNGRTSKGRKKKKTAIAVDKTKETDSKNVSPKRKIKETIHVEEQKEIPQIDILRLRMLINQELADYKNGKQYDIPPFVVHSRLRIRRPERRDMHPYIPEYFIEERLELSDAFIHAMALKLQAPSGYIYQGTILYPALLQIQSNRRKSDAEIINCLIIADLRREYPLWAYNYIFGQHMDIFDIQEVLNMF